MLFVHTEAGKVYLLEIRRFSLGKFRKRVSTAQEGKIYEDKLPVQLVILPVLKSQYRVSEAIKKLDQTWELQLIAGQADFGLEVVSRGPDQFVRFKQPEYAIMSHLCHVGKDDVLIYWLQLKWDPPEKGSAGLKII